MRANDIIKAVKRKYYDGALVTEMALDVMHDPADIRRYRLNRTESLHGKDSATYEYMEKFLLREGEITDQETIPLSMTEYMVSQRRIDGLLYHRKRFIALEVKVSVTDFRRETPQKRAPWEKVTHQFAYVTPKGLLDPKDIPSHCGLWEVDSDGSIKITKKAKVNKVPDPMPQQLFVALMYRNMKTSK